MCSLCVRVCVPIFRMSMWRAPMTQHNPAARLTQPLPFLSIPSFCLLAAVSQIQTELQWGEALSILSPSAAFLSPSLPISQMQYTSHRLEQAQRYPSSLSVSQAHGDRSGAVRSPHRHTHTFPQPLHSMFNVTCKSKLSRPLSRITQQF